MQLRVASYNIRKAIGLDRRRDPERIVAVLREVDADVIALQEADRRVGDRASAIPRVLLDDTDWQALPLGMRARSLGWHGNALLVRRGIVAEAFTPLELPRLEPRGAVWAQLEHEGRRFCVVGTHLDLSGIRRRAQIRTILEWLDHECPTILLGDFNQWGSQSGAMREFDERWRLVDPGRSFPSRRPVARLDRILVTQECKVARSGVHHSALAARGSDHLPVWADVTLP